LEPQGQSIDLRELLWTVRRYTWPIILSLELSLCAAAIYYKNSTPLYESQIVVAVDETTQMSSALEPLVRSDRDRLDPRERILKVESKIRGRAFLADIVQRLGMNRDPVLLLQASEASKRWRGVTAEEYALRISINRIGKKISISPGPASFIRIVVTDRNPQSARKLAGMIGDALVEESRRSTLASVQARGEFSNDQIAVYEDRLRKAEHALRTFQESSLREGLASGPITAQNLNYARGVHRSSDEEMQQLRLRIQAGRDEWRSRAGDAPVPELTSPRAAQWTARLGELEVSYGLSLFRAGLDSQSESEEIQTRIAASRQALFAEIDELAQALPGDFSKGARSAAAGIALDSAVLGSLKERRDRLSAMIDTYLRSVERSPREEMELQRLRADLQASRELLVTLQKEATSSRLSEALATSTLGLRLDIVEPPLLPFTAASPQPLKIFGIAALLGPILAGGIVFAGERLALVLRSLEQVESEFGLRVIGTIPRIEGWSRPGSYLKTHWAPLAVIAVLALTCIYFAVDAVVVANRSTPSATLGLRP